MEHPPAISRPPPFLGPAVPGLKQAGTPMRYGAIPATGGRWLREIDQRSALRVFRRNVEYNLPELYSLAAVIQLAQHFWGNG